MSRSQLIYWNVCGQCGYEVAASERARCLDCDHQMMIASTAGVILDDRNIVTTTASSIEIGEEE